MIHTFFTFVKSPKRNSFNIFTWSYLNLYVQLKWIKQGRFYGALDMLIVIWSASSYRVL